MNSEQVDVVVIGGGPAGSAYATLVARSGLSVRVLEGTQFPRHHIGESLLAMSMPILDDLGVTDTLEQAGFLPKTGAVFVWGRSQRRVDLSFPAPHRAYQVRRGEFDQLLLDHAQRCGVGVWSQQWAKEIRTDDSGRVTAVISDGEHGRTTHTARLVVDASGLFQFLPKRFSLPVAVSGPRRIAISGYYRNADRVQGEQANNVISEATRDGWVWFIPLDEHTTSVGFVGDEIDLSASPADTLAEQIGTSVLVASLLENASAERNPRLLRYTNHIVSSPLWQDGYLLVGDTALFVDPLFSTGVHGALYGAASAAAASVGHLVDGRSEGEVAAWYDATMRSHYTRIQTMVGLLYGINGAESRFWATRDLSRLSAAEAEAIAARLGPISVPLFLTGHGAGTLDIPEELVTLLLEFHTDPSPSKPITAAHIALAHGVEVRSTLTRRNNRVVPGVSVHDRRNRCPEVKIPEGSAAADLLRQLDAGPIDRDAWSQDPTLQALVSVLHSSGLVVEKMPATAQRV
jgi:halogenation protein CepH